MFIAQLLCCALLLVTPALTLLSGKRYRQAASSFGCKQGFFNPSAMLSADAWTLSQNTAAQFFTIGSVLLAVIGVLLLFVIPAEDMRTQLFIASIIVGLQLVILVFLMAIVEMRVQGKLKSSSAA